MLLKRRRKQKPGSGVWQKAVIVKDANGREFAFRKVTADSKSLLKRRYNMEVKKMVALYPPPHFNVFCDHSEGKEI